VLLGARSLTAALVLRSAWVRLRFHSVETTPILGLRARTRILLFRQDEKTQFAQLNLHRNWLGRVRPSANDAVWKESGTSRCKEIDPSLTRNQRISAQLPEQGM